MFHSLWDSDRGCHYDHEHGQNPFTPEVAATFPGFDLRELIGGVGVYKGVEVFSGDGIPAGFGPAFAWGMAASAVTGNPPKQMAEHEKLPGRRGEKAPRNSPYSL